MLPLLVHFLVSENTCVGVGDCLMNGEYNYPLNIELNKFNLIINNFLKDCMKHPIVSQIVP